MYDELLDFKAYREKPFVKTFGRRPPPRGVYLHGGVGRGKSMLMDAFYSHIQLRRKRRLHFHSFMQEVHHTLSQRNDEVDPLASVAAELAAAARLICLDEFNVSDIADAMILARLLEALVGGGVVFVMTSNYAPAALYHNGLQRERFLPAVQLIEEHLDIVNVDGTVDYRLRELEKIGSYQTPLGEGAERRLELAFAALCPNCGGSSSVAINGRQIAVKRLGAGVVWFDFSELCGGARSQLDYLELAMAFHSLFLSGVPVLSPEQTAEARRFTWLVDILYDHRVKLMLSAAAPPHELYVAGLNSAEFARTVSRLVEMQSSEYLGLGHIA